ncbi:MAG TPA: glycosyltransferase family 2 protein [Candidatus Dojkabacteria bacterium]|nr:glycosyltransferase family 2 protein [Candidatus Dojkabacteria bacterium]HQF37180.1 glycosyltransferase family 2 protein [Candidatus Dojkabacteria bacterium]
MKKISFTRLLDLLPGLFVWSVIIGVFVGSYFFPIVVAYFIILFNVYWVLKTVSMNYYYIRSFIMLRAWCLFNWKGRAEALTGKSEISAFLINEYHFISTMSLRDIFEKTHEKLNFEKKRFITLPYWIELPILLIQKRVAIWLIQSEINHFNKQKETDIIWDYKKIKHFIIIPFAKEPYSVLKPTVDRLAKQDCDTKSIVVVLATEKACPTGQDIASQLTKEYEGVFADIITTVHELKTDEIRGKSANMWYAATVAKQKIDNEKMNEDFITMTSCDCDSQFPTNYFSVLTYEFCKNPLRYRKYWNGSMIYYDNIWEVPFYVRVANTLFSCTALATHSRPNMIQVSTYSGSYKLIKDIGFWTKDKIPEDWNMYFKAVFKYGKDVSVVPLFLSIFSDAAGSTTHWKSFVNQYEQVKRWSWGVSDDSWIIQNMISTRRKFSDWISVFIKGINATVDHFLWPLYGFVLAFGANIPPLISKPFSNTVLGNNLSPIISIILTISTIQFLGIVLLDTELKPKRPDNKRGFFSYILYFLEFIFMPITGIIFGSLPALDAHTRLLMGKRMEYRITEKQ